MHKVPESSYKNDRKKCSRIDKNRKIMDNNPKNAAGCVQEFSEQKILANDSALNTATAAEFAGLKYGAELWREKSGRKYVMGQWNEYLEVLASKAPTPGGGSAAAVYGAVGTALGEMVGNLTTGKKKFAIYEEEIQKILVRLQEARMDFIRLEKADEQAFEPLSEVYRMKAETDEEKKAKEERMEECLKAAAQVPMEVMERAVSVMDDIEFLALNGSRLAVSDAGVGIQGIRSALLGAVMSVYINTKMMKDREYAEAVNQQAELLIKKGTEQADRIYEIVLKAVRG